MVAVRFEPVYTLPTDPVHPGRLRPFPHSAFPRGTG